MSNQIVSLIRTWVPIGVGFLVAWLASFGVAFDGTAEAALSAGITAAVAGLYYAAARWLETRLPWTGFLLGVSKAPTYTAGITSLQAHRQLKRGQNARRTGGHRAA